MVAQARTAGPSSSCSFLCSHRRESPGSLSCACVSARAPRGTGVPTWHCGAAGAESSLWPKGRGCIRGGGDTRLPHADTGGGHNACGPHDLRFMGDRVEDQGFGRNLKVGGPDAGLECHHGTRAALNATTAFPGHRLAAMGKPQGGASPDTAQTRRRSAATLRQLEPFRVR